MRACPRLNPKYAGLLMFVTAIIGGKSTAAAQPATGQRPLQPRDFSLTTKDGVQLKITYYPSPAGQQAVPVVMLHDFNETRAVLLAAGPAAADSAGRLGGFCSAGAATFWVAAVVTVDLRGHGESKTMFVGDDVVELDAAHFRPKIFRTW